MTTDRTFKFQTGYTISVRPGYDPRLYYMSLEQYREDNPPPEPPIVEKQIPTKTGFRTLTNKDYQDEHYMRSYTIWDAQMLSANVDMLYDMAIDPDSIDQEVVEAGRAWAAENGIGVPRDDVRAYLRFVVTPLPENAKPGTVSELAKFHTWLTEVGGPSEALVNQFLNTFRAGIQGKTNLQRLAATN